MKVKYVEVDIYIYEAFSVTGFTNLKIKSSDRRVRQWGT